MASSEHAVDDGVHEKMDDCTNFWAQGFTSNNLILVNTCKSNTINLASWPLWILVSGLVGRTQLENRMESQADLANVR